MYIVQCTCTMHTLYTNIHVYYTMYNVQCTLYIVHVYGECVQLILVYKLVVIITFD